MKDPIRDWAAFKHLVAVPTGLDGTLIATLRRECAVRNQAFGLVMGYPGFHSWEGHVEGGIQTLSYLYYDDRTILDEWFELQFQAGTAGLALFLAEKPDYVCFGGSGTLTMANPELVERYALPALKKWTAMTKAAGIPSVLHSCGKSRSLVDLLAEGTDLDCINPLEAPPMGDVDLREVKRARGSRMALMGNLHTTDVMLKGSPDGVYRASVEAIEAAAEGGGFILSTGDQCPRDTPEENLFAMLRAAEERGRY
jgi:uroporphyrinogen decarboxylase